MTSFGKFDDSDFQAFVKHFDNEVQGERFLRDIEKSFAQVTGMALNIIKKNTRDIVYRDQNKPWSVTGNLIRQWGASNVKRNGDDLVVELFNNADYAIYVEMGHRGVYIPSLGKTIHLDSHYTEGKHILEKSLDEIKKLINEIIDEEFQKAVERLLDF